MEIRGDLHLRLAHRDVLEARHLHPRVHLLDVERQCPLRLQQPEHQHALLPDAGLLRIKLRDAVARRDLQSHALLGNNRQLPALLARLAEHKPRHRGRFRRLRSRPGEIHVELLLPFSLALQVHRDDAALGRLQFSPMTERRAADAFHVQPRRQHKADAENSRARHRHGHIRREDRAVFAERQRLLRLHAHVGFDRRRLQHNCAFRIRVTKRAAQRQPGDLRAQGIEHSRREVFEVDWGKRFRCDAVELDFVPRRNADRTKLPRRTIHADQSCVLLERQRPGRDLRAHDERERTRLRRAERDAQLPRVRVEPPQRNYRRARRFGILGVHRRPGARRVDDIRDGRPAGHVENQFAQLALRRTHLHLMHAFDDARRRHVELEQFREEHRLLPLHVTAARLPGNPRISDGREHERRHGRVRRGVVALHRDGVR